MEIGEKNNIKIRRKKVRKRVGGDFQVPSLDLRRHLLRGRLLGAFWLVLGGILALGEAPGWILKASGRVRGAILRLLGLISRCFFDARELALTYRIKGCMNCCRKPILAFTWAFRFPLQRGGTCEAHPPPPEGRAVRARQ